MANLLSFIPRQIPSTGKQNPIVRNCSAALEAVTNNSGPQTENKQIKQAKKISYREGQVGIQMRETELHMNEHDGVDLKPNEWQQVDICSRAGGADCGLCYCH